MKKQSHYFMLATLLAVGWFCPNIRAVTVQTLGYGSAVSAVDRMATFDIINSTYTAELGNYTEGGLRVTTGSQAWGADPPMSAGLDPFHLPGGTDGGFFAFANGTAEWVVIQTTNQAGVHAVEFLYGNTWTTGGGQYQWGSDGAYVEWQTLNNGTVVSSGQIGPNPQLSVGTVIGFYDPAGFDQLQVKCKSPNAADSTLQAIALDNLMVQLTYQPPVPVIYQGDFSVNPTNHIPSLTVWNTYAGVQYRLVYSENLASGVWTPVTPPLPAGWVAGGGTLTLSDTNAPGKSARFYRVEVR